MDVEKGKEEKSKRAKYIHHRATVLAGQAKV